MSEQTITKQCSKCKEIKPTSEFFRNRTCKDNLNYWCKSCRKILNNKYEKTAKCKATRKHYRQSERGKAAQKRYQQTEKGKQANRRKVKKYSQTQIGKQNKIWWDYKYYHSEKGQKNRKQYLQSIKAKKCALKCASSYRRNNPEKVKAHQMVNKLVQLNVLPRPDSLQCLCGNKAKDYHHYKGYEPEYWFDILPICRKCHIAIS